MERSLFCSRTLHWAQGFLQGLMEVIKSVTSGSLVWPLKPPRYSEPPLHTSWSRIYWFWSWKSKILLFFGGISELVGGERCTVPSAVGDLAVNRVSCPRSVLPWFLIARIEYRNCVLWYFCDYQIFSNIKQTSIIIIIGKWWFTFSRTWPSWPIMDWLPVPAASPVVTVWSSRQPND